ncbi:MAG: hypothetical protein ACOYYF_06465 [Chloroflexota bacterium]|nr:hypothetical protein [Chloroflexota bacterium]MBI5704189.1 hypothetical protein [Chloroflexota bacterium]
MPTPKIYTESEPLSKADEDLLDYFKNIEKNSLDTLESAARQIISLVTTLLGLFFGVLAFKDNPAYLGMDAIRLAGALSAGMYIAALFFALDVVMPRRLDIPSADLDAMKQLLITLFDRKNRSLLWAQIAFGIGTVWLFILILILLFRG